MNLDNTTIISVLVVVILCFVLYKSFSLMLKIGFVLLVTGYLYYQYGQGII